MFFDFLNCGNVSRHFLPRSSEREAVAADRSHNELFLPKSSINVGADAMGYTSRVYGSKSTVHEHFQHGNKAGMMTEIFRILLAEYGGKSASLPSGRPGTALFAISGALSKNQR